MSSMNENILQNKKKFARLRQEVLGWTREFFIEKKFLEVATPVVTRYGTAEAYIDPMETQVLTDKGRTWMGQLIPSPEIHHKKLLASGYENIFEIARVHRNGESPESNHHNMEFTLLEWYRLGADYRVIMSDLEALIRFLGEKVLKNKDFPREGPELFLTNSWERISVAEAFRVHAGVDFAKDFPSVSSGDPQKPYKFWEPLIPIAEKKGYGKNLSLDDAFYFIFLNEIENKINGRATPVFLYDYPIFQAAFSRPAGDPRYGERFELYAGGLELGNGYSELTDPVEQKKRFDEGNAIRQTRGKRPSDVDPEFLALLKNIPQAGGVALGMDRLLMLLGGTASIDDVILFPTRKIFE